MHGAAQLDLRARSITISENPLALTRERGYSGQQRVNIDIILETSVFI